MREKYKKEVIPQMKEKFGLHNNLEVPQISKVTINSGVGKFLKDSSSTEEVNQALTAISGQKPVMTKARKSIAGFKIREGLGIGFSVTLRGRRMWDFLEILVGSALPRVRDFRGIKESSVDGYGNLNIGIREHLIFPEISPEQVRNTISFQVNITTNGKDREKGMALFRMLGFPIENKQ